MNAMRNIGLPPPRRHGRAGGEDLLESILTLAAPAVDAELERKKNELESVNRDIAELKRRAATALAAHTAAQSAAEDDKSRSVVLEICLMTARNDLMFGPLKVACDTAVNSILELEGKHLKEIERSLRKLTEKRP